MRCGVVMLLCTRHCSTSLDRTKWERAKWEWSAPERSCGRALECCRVAACVSDPRRLRYCACASALVCSVLCQYDLLHGVAVEETPADTPPEVPGLHAASCMLRWCCILRVACRVVERCEKPALPRG